MVNTRALLSFVLLATQQRAVSAHGNMLCPAPRQRRDEKVESWTSWVGIHGGGPFVAGFGNSANLNAAIGGGGEGAIVGKEPGGHGLCGDIGSRKGFMAPNQYGPTDPRGTYVAGGKVRDAARRAGGRRVLTARSARAQMTVKARITAYHAGWFEFRLAVPADGGADRAVPITQARAPAAPRDNNNSSSSSSSVTRPRREAAPRGRGAPALRARRRRCSTVTSSRSTSPPSTTPR